MNPTVGLENIISPDGSSNIAKVKEYFCDEVIVKQIAKDVSIKYETLISGKFTIVIEPLAIYQYNGLRYAMTATEAALYDRQVNGGVKKVMGYLTHQNLPLAMYLERAELGISPGGGSGLQGNEYIISTLGIGTVNFNDEEEAPGSPSLPPEVYDYEYHANTDVVTSILVEASSEINPDSPGKAKFGLPGGNITKEYVIPAGEDQLVWVKWRTPDVEEDTIIEIPVDISKGGTDKATIRCKIIALVENTPPNPEGRDRNDGFRLGSPPSDSSLTKAEWGEWWAKWHEVWVWIKENHKTSCPDDCSTRHGYWEDQGYYEFHWRSYSASLSVSANTVPDDRAVTASGGTIKSGYGINAQVEVHMTTNGGSDNTAEVQHIEAVFPEFGFMTYNRFLVPEGGGSPAYNCTWEFKENEYSQFNNRVHFTPIWYPDATNYPVTFFVMDAWTPAGQLVYYVTSTDIDINGNVYQDWHIAPGFGDGPG
ncbi:MAG: hypothetical protein ACK5LX_11555 [Oscillospiraceae bacterium]